MEDTAHSDPSAGKEPIPRGDLGASLPKGLSVQEGAAKFLEMGAQLEEEKRLNKLRQDKSSLSMGTPFHSTAQLQGHRKRRASSDEVEGPSKRWGKESLSPSQTARKPSTAVPAPVSRRKPFASGLVAKKIRSCPRLDLCSRLTFGIPEILSYALSKLTTP